MSRLRIWAGAFSLLVVSLAPSWAFGGSVSESRMFFVTHLIVNDEMAPVTSWTFPIAERARASTVGTVMALLATFQDAEVLPLEGTAEANQLIHGLIQLQSALMKSSSPELRDYVVAALRQGLRTSREESLALVHDDGLTLAVLESLILYTHEHHFWDEPQIVAAFHAYNVTHQDWALMARIFTEAKNAFHVKGRSIHRVYEQWREQMPGRG